MNTALSTQTTPGAVSKTGIVLSTMDEIWRFSETVIASGMAPKGISNPSAATIIIQMGMELGLPPMASLQNIAAINGRPSIWGDAMLGLVRATGELEEFTEWFEHKGTKLDRSPIEFPDDLMAVCRVKRRGYDAAEASFSVADAKRAKLWGKQGPWTEYTARMLKVRARSFGLRDEFGDALRGLYTAEEELDLPMRNVTPATPPSDPYNDPRLAQSKPEVTTDAPPVKKTAKAQQKAAVEPEPETTPENSTTEPEPLVDMPPREQMIEDFRTVTQAMNITPQTAAKRYAAYGVIPEGKKMQDLSTKELFEVWKVREIALQEGGAK